MWYHDLSKIAQSGHTVTPNESSKLWFFALKAKAKAAATSAAAQYNEINLFAFLQFIVNSYSPNSRYFWNCTWRDFGSGKMPYIFIWVLFMICVDNVKNILTKK